MSEETEPRRPSRAHRRVSEETEAAIRRCHADGMSQRQTAREVGLTHQDISRWSKRAGLNWLPVPAVAATQAERYRARRQALAEAMLADAANIRERMWDNGIEVIGTRDGAEIVKTELPSARAVNDYASAVAKVVASAEHLAGDGPGIEGARSMLSRLHDQVRRAVVDE